VIIKKYTYVITLSIYQLLHILYPHIIIILMFSVTDTIIESLRLAWQHKILLVFALLLVSGLNGNFNSGGSNSSSSSDESTQDKEQKIQTNSSSSSVININGQELDINNTTEQGFPYVQEIKEITSKYSSLKDESLNKSIPYIVFVAISVLVLIILSVGFVMFLQSWATGALIGGIDDVLNNKPYTLFSLANWGRKSVRQLFKYNLYVAIISFVIILFGLIIPIVMFATGNTALEIIGGITLFVAVIGMIIFFYFIGFGGQFAVRFIVINGENYKTAFKNGIETFKKNMGVTLKLVLANCLVGCVFMIIIGAILIGVVGGVAIGLVPAIIVAVANSPVLMIVFGILGIVIGVPLLIGFMVVMSGVSGFTTTYTMFTYHKLYRFVMGIDKGRVKDTVDVFGTPPISTPENKVTQGGQNAE